MSSTEAPSALELHTRLEVLTKRIDRALDRHERGHFYLLADMWRTTRDQLARSLGTW